MDPNETLKQLRSNVAAALQLADDYEKDPDAISSEDGEAAVGLLDVIAQQVEALDQWLSRGGFLPTDWIPANACEAGIDGFLCSRSVHPDSWHHVALTSAGWVRRRWTDAEPDHPEPFFEPYQTDVQEAVAHHDRQLLGPPDPAHADGSLIDQLDDELHRAGEIVRRMREGR